MKTPQRLSTRLAIAVATATLLVGCGGSDTDDSDADSSASSSESADTAADSSAEPASGEEVSTDDFSFTAPEGWEDATDKVPGFQAEVQYVESEPDGFANNVNVLREPNGFEGDTAEYAEANLTGLERSGYESVEQQDDFGDFGVITSVGNQNGTEFLLNQYFTVRDGEAWVVTFTYADDVSDADRVATSESVMQTWEWA